MVEGSCSCSHTPPKVHGAACRLSHADQWRVCMVEAAQKRSTADIIAQAAAEGSPETLAQYRQSNRFFLLSVLALMLSYERLRRRPV